MNKDTENMSVIDNIKNSYDELYKTEQKVAKYIIENMNEIVDLNVSGLASRSQTSEATVVRTAKHLGYSGYFQMRLLISKDIGKLEQISNEEEDLSSSQKFFSYEAERIKDLANYIDFKDLIKIANIILESNQVHVVAVGNTTSISGDLCFRLQRLGINSLYSPLAEYFYNQITLGSSKDTLIAISRSGSSKQVIRAVEQAQKKNMKIIIITGEMNLQFIENADVVLEVKGKYEEPRTLGTPDSHLLEYSINDAILYATRSVSRVLKGGDKQNSEDRDYIGILLSEFKV